MRALLRRVAATLIGGAALLLGGCASTGMGGGELARPGHRDEPVLFSWRSGNGGISGQMIATLPDATYRGRFFQITRQTERATIAPLWDGWTEGWYDWPYWDRGTLPPYPVERFITRYSGKVVASLQSPAGKRMRCRLHMIDPARGMAGGGEGECQIAGAGTIRARF
jgi:hypothetical protein